jgi:hypothetical protein
MTDDPQNTPHPEEETRDTQLAQIAVRVHLLREDIERERDAQEIERREQAQFRTWLASQIKAMQADIASLAHDARLRNERITELEHEASRLPCKPGGGNSNPCQLGDDGGMEP